MKITSFIPVMFISFISCVSSLRQLAFSGGGSFGAVEIGIIEKIRSFDKEPFDFYTGISAGGINSGYLSHFSNIDDGIKSAKKFYSNIKNYEIYSLTPKTNVSLLNTKPLEKTINTILSKLNDPVIETYIGTTNLYSGHLDIYRYDKLSSVNEQTQLLLCTSAIPIVFPPITFNNNQYADGGTLQNELLNIKHDNSYLNITFITPYSDDLYDNTTIISLKQMALRTLKVVKTSFNNEFNKINYNCENPSGEINKYYVNSELLLDYNMLNFDNGDDLIDIGFNNIKHIKTYIC